MTLFKTVLNKSFSPELYRQLFVIRIQKLLQKLTWIEEIYGDEKLPEQFIKIFYVQKLRLLSAQDRCKTDVIYPEMLI